MDLTNTTSNVGSGKQTHACPPSLPWYGGVEFRRLLAAARLILALSGLLAFVAPAGAQPAPSADERPPPGHTRMLAVPQTLSPPTIDGGLSDAAWRNAVVSDAFL